MNGSEEALTTTEGSAVLSPCRAEHTAPTEVPVRSHPGELPLCLLMLLFCTRTGRQEALCFYVFNFYLLDKDKDVGV